MGILVLFLFFAIVFATNDEPRLIDKLAKRLATLYRSQSRKGRRIAVAKIESSMKQSANLDYSLGTYSAPVRIGMPYQDSWLDISMLHSTSIISPDSGFDPERSVFLTNYGSTQTFHSEQGQIPVQIYADDFVIASILALNVTFYYTANERVHSLFGLGPPSKNLPNGSILEVISTAYKLNRKIFGLWLDGQNSNAGSLSFGFADDIYHYPESMRGHNVLLPDDGLWSVKGSMAFLGKESIGYGGIYIMDSYIDALVVPRMVAEAIGFFLGCTSKTFDNQDFYYLSNTELEYPDLIFKIGDGEYRVPASLYVSKNDARLKLIGLDLIHRGWLCWIMGQPFLSSVYSAYEWGEYPTVYLAQKRF